MLLGCKREKTHIFNIHVCLLKFVSWTPGDASKRGCFEQRKCIFTRNRTWRCILAILRVLGSIPLWATIFIPTKFACWHTVASLLMKTHNQNDWSANNQIEYNGLRFQLEIISKLFIYSRCSFDSVKNRLSAYGMNFHVNTYTPGYNISYSITKHILNMQTA